MKKSIVLLFLSAACSLASWAQNIDVVDTKIKTSKNAKGKSQSNEIGSINWTGQFIEARGESVFNPKFTVPGQAEAMAREGAKAMAMANLLEMVESVKVTKTTTVSNLINDSVGVKTEVEGWIKGARIVSSQKGPNSYTVVLRMPLYGDEGLAALFKDQKEETTSADDNTPAPTPSVEDKTGTTGGQTGTTGEAALLETAKNLAEAAKKNGLDIIPLLNLKGKRLQKLLTLIPGNIVNQNGDLVVNLEEIFKKTGVSPKVLKYSNELVKILKDLGVKTQKIDAVYKEGKIVINDSQLNKTGKFWSWVKNNGGKAAGVLIKVLPLLLGA